MMFTLIAAVLIYGVIHLFALTAAKTKYLGSDWNVGPRDEKETKLPVKIERLSRAFDNFKETLPFLVLALILNLWAGQQYNYDVNSQLGLTGLLMYILARLIYVPLYVGGVKYWRSLTWTISMIGVAVLIAGPILVVVKI